MPSHTTTRCQLQVWGNILLWSLMAVAAVQGGRAGGTGAYGAPQGAQGAQGGAYGASGVGYGAQQGNSSYRGCALAYVLLLPLPALPASCCWQVWRLAG